MWSMNELARLGAEARKRELEKELADINGFLRTTSGEQPKQASGHRTMSAEGRARISAAQKKRWSEFHRKQKKAAA